MQTATAAAALEAQRNDIISVFNDELRFQNELGYRIADFNVARGTCQQTEDGSFLWLVELTDSHEPYELHAGGWATDIPFNEGMTPEDVADALLTAHDHSRTLYPCPDGEGFSDLGVYEGDLEPLWLAAQRHSEAA